MSVIYTCYDINQKQFLLDKGCKELLHGLHPKTQRTFWVFERNEKLNMTLKDWFSQKR